MKAQTKPSPDDTRERIMETAETLFRRLGYAKTAVADIANELGMSAANIYRFFASKNAIVEAICRRCLSEVENKAWAVARAKGPADQRLERLVLEILAYHKANLVTEQRVNDMVCAAIEHSWETIRAHDETMRHIVELILRDGIEAGDFEAANPSETAEVFLRSVVSFTHPMIVGQCMEEGQDLEDEARKSVRFLLKAIKAR
jgi:AcrR family transcriptional regulator